MVPDADPRHVPEARPAHPMRASVILVTAVSVLIVILAVSSVLG
jgi:hypothetical protein